MRQKELTQCVRDELAVLYRQSGRLLRSFFEEPRWEHVCANMLCLHDTLRARPYHDERGRKRYNHDRKNQNTHQRSRLLILENLIIRVGWAILMEPGPVSFTSGVQGELPAYSLRGAAKAFVMVANR